MPTWGYAYMETHEQEQGLVWKNFSILIPKLVLEYAEDILSDSRLKNCAKCKGG